MNDISNNNLYTKGMFFRCEPSWISEGSLYLYLHEQSFIYLILTIDEIFQTKPGENYYYITAIIWLLIQLILMYCVFIYFAWHSVLIRCSLLFL